MALIDPVRKLVVYPSLLNSIRARWNQAFGTIPVSIKDERKPVVLVIINQKLRWKNGFAKISYFFLLTSESLSTDPPPFFLLPFNF
jgi:hypothetical protein